MTKRVIVAADALERFCGAIFTAAGLPGDMAAVEAEILVWADLRGVGSHGMLRVPSYVQWIRSGLRRADARIATVSEQGATAVIDADRAPGLFAMRLAMDRAADLARTHAIGWVLLRETTHTGAMGYYVRRTAEQGLIGIASCSSRPLMAFHGSRAPALGTAPLAIAVPRTGAPPLVLDMSSAAIAIGRLAEARQAGTALPEGVALDTRGRVTTDPDAAAVPLPLAGPKGAGLSLMIECLTSLLVGRPLIASALEDEAERTDYVQNALAIALDPAVFPGGATLADEVDRLARDLAALPRAEGIDEILMPGERGDREAVRRCAEGIPLPGSLWETLGRIADGLGVARPSARTE